jgi:tetratricopeptide (TPR) repeat protein
MERVRLHCIASVLSWLLATTALGQAVDSQRYFNSAVVAFESLEYEQAVTQAEKAIARAANADQEQRGNLLLGVILADMGRPSRALRAFEMAFGLDPNRPLPVDTSPKVLALAQDARSRVRRLLSAGPPGLGFDGGRADAGPPSLVAAWQGSAGLCSDADELMAKVWTPAVRAQLQSDLSNSTRPDVAAIAPALVSRMGEWAGSWSDHSLATCLRDKLRKGLPESAYRARRSCLRLGVEIFADLIQTLRQTPGPSDSVLHLTSRLPSPFDCTQVSSSPAQLTETEASMKASRALAKAIALYDTGRSQEASLLAEQALEGAGPGGGLAFQAEASFWVGVLRAEAGQLKQARAALEATVPLALEAGQPRLAIRALSALTNFYVYRFNDLKSAERAKVQAQQLLQREGNPPHLVLQLDIDWGVAQGLKERHAESLREFEHGLTTLDLVEASAGRDQKRAQLENMIGTSLYFLGRKREAKATFEKCVEDTIRAFGPKHKSLILYWSNLGALQYEDCELAASEAAFRSALELAEALKKPKGEAYPASIGLGEVLRLTGRLAAARPLIDEALAYVETHFGRETPPVLEVLGAVGAVRRSAGDARAALAYHQRARSLAKKLGDQELRWAATIEVGRDLLQLGRRRELGPVIEACAKQASHPVKNDGLWCALFRAAHLPSNKTTGELRKTLEATPCSNACCGEAVAEATKWLAR